MLVYLSNLRSISEKYSLTIIQVYTLFYLLIDETSIQSLFNTKQLNDSDLEVLLNRGYILEYKIDSNNVLGITYNRIHIRKLFRDFISSPLNDMSTLLTTSSSITWADEFLTIFFDKNPTRICGMTETTLLLDYFIQLYPFYSKEDILFATNVYVRNNNPKYLVKSSNFILKEEVLPSGNLITKSDLLLMLEVVTRLKDEDLLNKVIIDDKA